MYFSSSVLLETELTSSTKMSALTRMNFANSIKLKMIKTYDKVAL